MSQRIPHFFIPRCLFCLRQHVLATAIKQMREERGRIKGIDDTRFRETVETLGPHISLDALRDSITTACVEALSDTWDERYGQLKAFRERFGHCNVPVGGLEYLQLRYWVTTQRSQRKSGHLSAYRIKRLDELGFTWDAHKDAWEDRFNELVGYTKTHGHCNVPPNWIENIELSQWVAAQRSRNRTKKLGDERTRRLNEIGFVWSPSDAEWEQMFVHLSHYNDEHGHCNVSVNERSLSQLRGWITRNRSMRRFNKLSPERIQRLEHIGFVWNEKNWTWHEMFSAYVDSRRKHLTGGLTPNVGRDDPRLLRWIKDQCSLKEHGKLSRDRVRQLDSVAFDWNPGDFAWEQMFAVLLEYKRIHGHCAVPKIYTDNPKLASWVTLQRQQKKKREIDESNKRRLEAIGFVWDVREGHWETMFSAMAEYQHAHENCDVAMFESECPELSRWVKAQRAIGREQMQEDRAKRLDALGFTWDARKLLWEEMFRTLVAYKQVHGNCDVPIYWPNNRELRYWVATQRSLRKKRMLEDDLIRRLDAIGFQWSIKQKTTE